MPGLPLSSVVAEHAPDTDVEFWLRLHAQAMLWSAEDPSTEARIKRFIEEIERRLLAFDGTKTSDRAHPPAWRP